MQTWLITGCSSGYGLFGPIAHAIAERKLAAFRSDIDAWRDITIATDFDQPRALATSSV